jgi:hypothetical protein
LCLVAIGGLAGCQSTAMETRAPTIAKTSAQGAVEGRPSLSMPIQLPGHSTCVIPFAIEDRKGWFDDRDPFTRGGYAADAGYRYSSSLASVNAALYSQGGSSRWHNAIVRDMKNGEEWTVLEKRGVISRYEAFVRPGTETEPPVSIGLVFIATVEDTNKDGSLDDRDASVAVVAEGDGRRPRIVTPARAQVWSTSYDGRLGVIYLYVVEDTDGDGQYTPMDAPMPYVFDPHGNGPAVRLVSEDAAVRVERLLK